MIKLWDAHPTFYILANCLSLFSFISRLPHFLSYQWFSHYWEKSCDCCLSSIFYLFYIGFLNQFSFYRLYILCCLFDIVTFLLMNEILQNALFLKNIYLSLTISIVTWNFNNLSYTFMKDSLLYVFSRQLIVSYNCSSILLMHFLHYFLKKMHSWSLTDDVLRKFMLLFALLTCAFLLSCSIGLF